MSRVNFKEALNIGELSDVIGNTPLNMKQKEAIENIKNCAADKWQYVDLWYDEGYEEYREFLLSPLKLFDSIYKDSITDIYRLGYVVACRSAEQKKLIQEIYSCGKEFLEKVTFFYLIDLIQDTFNQVGRTENDATLIEKELMIMKERLGI